MDGAADCGVTAKSWHTGVLPHQSEKAYVEKIFTFTRGEYLMDVRYKVRNISQEPWQGAFYAQLKRDGSDDPSQSSSMGMQAYLGAALTTSEERYQKVSFDDLEEGKFKSVEEGGWAAILQHYFVSAWIPAQDQQPPYNGRYVKGNYIFGFYDKHAINRDDYVINLSRAIFCRQGHVFD